MWTERRRLLLGAGALLAQAALPGAARAIAAGGPPETQQPGALRIAVYADFPPYSYKGKGVDVALGKALADKLGLRAEFVEFQPGEDMSDDLRNMVWRGHYLGTRPADVMLHVPVDARFAAQNDKVAIFGPYHLETMAVARDPARLPPVAGSAAAGLEVFTRELIGAEVDSHASDFLMQVLNGRLRGNVRHFRTPALAVEALERGEIAAVLGTHTELQAALAGSGRYALDRLALPELRVAQWPLGMAVKAEATPLAEALGRALGELQRSGAVARLFAEQGLSLTAP
ncbi:substrate-binding periplasmic protein [Thauera sinica]|uniref:Substrate-binding periplasmic protein n=1 Tax=Thauera sinica TaxID=2665146 RepID=A0ABW1AUJ5_9RHOO|nr:transporter substrate-binding domain-containing protein [Thauera sp. K11]ATE59332.1 ABC transporter substrate-binding protein [Thauera sp. K11]